MRSSVAQPYMSVCRARLKHSPSSVGIGFCEASSPHNGMPGWDQGSWGYHANDGVKFGSRATLAQYGPIYGTGDIVGCGFEYNTRSIFFTENGEHLGIRARGNEQEQNADVL